jgi:hypothetical protein
MTPLRLVPSKSLPWNETSTGRSGTARVTMLAMTPPYMTWTRLGLCVSTRFRVLSASSR